jgi:raffinose/stachyose/melibiose transport system permease protein
MMQALKRFPKKLTSKSIIHWKKVGLESLGILLFIIFFMPIVLVIINASKNSSFLVTSNPLNIDVAKVSILIDNIREVWSNPNINFQSAFLSSLIVTSLSLLSIVAVSSMAGWALVRRKTKMSSLVFYLFVAAMIIPFQVVMLPLVSWFRALRDFSGIPFLRSYFGMVIAYIGFGTPLSVFLYHGFIKSIPFELEEAAQIDGCNKFQTFIYVVLPILKPITITVIILNGIWIWNDFLLPLLVLGKGTSIQTIPLAIANYVGAFIVQWQYLLTAVLMAMAPVLVLFLFAQKYIIEGMVAGSIK